MIDREVWSCAGKTFLVGEYVALDGGPSILITTGPRFELRASEPLASSRIGAETAGFSPESPAGRFLKKHANELKGIAFEFFDPHEGKGGLGASSAQFALLYSFLSSRGNQLPDQLVAPVLVRLLEEYKACAWNGEGSVPSGADVVAQMRGGITLFDGRELTTQDLKWEFPTLSFSLVRTGVKLATHEHLKREQKIPSTRLRELVRQAKVAFDRVDEALLLKAVEHVRIELREAGLTAPRTAGLLEQLGAEPWVKASKGCGAMGADVLLIIHDRNVTSKMNEWAAARGLEICGTVADLSDGLRRE